MAFEPLVSIVIPVFNGSNFLREAIDSALSQTYKNIEVIVVNDGSNDNGATRNIAVSYGNKIKYLEKANGGTSTALNLGIANMKGEYFCWLSHDDLYRPNCISRQIETLANLENKQTITITDLDCMNHNYEITWPDTRYNDHRELWPARNQSLIYPVLYMKLHGCQLMFHKSVFEVVGIFDETSLVAQDYEFFYRAFKTFPSKLISEVLGTSRDADNRQGRRLKDLGAIEYSALFIKILESLDEKDISLLAPSKLELYLELQEIWKWAGYENAYKHITKKLMPQVQVNYSDLPGKRFNGYELHLEMRHRGFKASQIVWDKKSNQKSVISLSEKNNNKYYSDFIYKIEDEYNLKSITSPFMLDLIYDKNFIEAAIVHFHIINHPAFNINYLPIISKMKSVFLTLHDPWWLSGHCVHSGSCQKWKNICYDCEFLNLHYSIGNDNTTLQHLIKHNIIKSCDLTVIVHSKFMADKVTSSPVFENKRIEVVPLGVNQELFQPKVVGAELASLKIKEGNKILFARTDREFKGTNLLVATLEYVALFFDVTIITVGEPGILKLQNKKIQHIELGWIDDDELLACIYNVCDLFLMPSTYESFGLMAAEAMSCGTVVVATKSEHSALSETIDSPNCGVATSIENYANEVLRLLSNDAELNGRKKNSLRYALENYNFSRYVDKIESLYHDAASSFIPDDDHRLLLEQISKYSNKYRNSQTHSMVIEQNNSLLQSGIEYYKKYGMRTSIAKLFLRIRVYINRHGYRNVSGKLFRYTFTIFIEILHRIRDKWRILLRKVFRRF